MKKVAVLLLVFVSVVFSNQVVKGLSTSRNTITLIAGGDVMLGRSVNTQSQRRRDYAWAFARIADDFRSADLSLINLESPIVSGCRPTDTGMVFCAPPDHIQGLLVSGVDIANLANNHIYNYGQSGVNSTLNLLTQNGISPIGFEPAIKEVKGIKFGFLGYSPFLKLDRTQMVQEIGSLRSSVDQLIVTFHWGNEYQTSPTSQQKQLAHLAIDSGADIIIGHHPHWVQDKEIYQGKLIYYSLGNLIFDQMWSEKTREGLVVKFVFSSTGSLIETQELPIRIYDYGQPRFEE